MEYKTTCELCGNEYIGSCRHCAPRVNTWGIEGTLALYELAKCNKDLLAEELLTFVFTYYQGKIIQKRAAVQVLKKGLKLLGYKGKFERIHLYDDYTHLRTAAHSRTHRWRWRKDYCELCSGTNELKIHHIVPLSWGGVASEENCITLCQECHKSVHRKLSRYLNRYRLLGYIAPHKEEITKIAKLSIDEPCYIKLDLNYLREG
jgi:hypothetical protein